MLDAYENDFSNICNFLKRVISNDRISHAYLFDLNNNSQGENFVLSFVKEILCKNITDDFQRKCIINKVNSGNYVDLKIIEGNPIIKKDQITELQNDFNKLSVEKNKKIYIIKDAEKMNKQASNALLKFLEEPVDDIIAILTTNNINLILSTVISRCQLIKLPIFQNNSLLDNINKIRFNNDLDELNNDNYLEVLNCLKKTINYIENRNLDILIYDDKLFSLFLENRNSFLFYLELLLNYYFDIEKRYAKLSNLFFSSNDINMFDDICDSNIESINNKIFIVINALNDLKYNVNIGLLFNKLMIELCGV